MSMSETKGIARGVYPIDTGKVLIGRDYIPRRTQYATTAELFWQDILLRQESVWVKRLRRLIKLLRRG